MIVQTYRLFLTAALLAALFQALPAGEAATLFDPETDGAVLSEEDGKLYVEDRRQQYRMEIPAPYWRVRIPARIEMNRTHAPGGCAPGGGIPESLLLVIQNKDAPATGVSLEKMPYRFLMRGTEDLGEYMETREQALLEQMKGIGQLIDSGTRPRDGMLVYTAHYSFAEQDGVEKLEVMLANFLIRPPGKEVIVYQLQAFTPDKWFPLLKKDFENMINGFSYTGETAEQFFVPDAPDEKLPFARRRDTGAPLQCGEGLPGIIMAAAAVIVIYLLVKKKLAA